MVNYMNNNNDEKTAVCVIISTDKKDKRNGYKDCLTKKVRSINVLKFDTDEVSEQDKKDMCSVLREIDPEVFSTIEYNPDYDVLLKNEKDLITGNVPETVEYLFLYKTQLLNNFDNKKLDLILPVEVYICSLKPGSMFCKLDYNNQAMRQSVVHRIIPFSLIKYAYSVDESEDSDIIIVYRLVVDGLIESMCYEDEEKNKVPFLIPIKGKKIIDFIDTEDLKILEKSNGKFYTC